MKLESTPAAGSKAFLITGWILSAIPILMMGVMVIPQAIFGMKMVRDGMKENGFQEHHAPIILALEFGCALIYAIPQTAVLGAILMTGYLGGAVVTHLRQDQWQLVIPVTIGVIAWLGLFFRDARLRALLPFRC